MKLLFLGGAGMIGSAVAAHVVEQGHELTVVTRSQPRRPVPAGVRQLRADVRHADELGAVLGSSYDAVVNWVGYTPSDVADHAALFAGRAGQYVFISTCSVFARPVPQLPITESSPRRQPVFGYARNKLACEDLLSTWDQLPVTVVRPSHVYDETVVPVLAGWTAVERMRAGRPVVVHGDGTSLWSLMHAADFADALVPLLGNEHAAGESVNVVSGDILTWDQIHLALAHAAGVRDPLLVHRASETIGREWPGWNDVLLHDFRHSMLFDPTKLRRLVPQHRPRIGFSAGARAIVAHHDGAAAAGNADVHALFDRLCA